MTDTIGGLTYPIRLAPLPATRISSVVVGALVTLLGIGSGAAGWNLARENVGGWIILGFGVVMFALGLLLVTRYWGLAAVLTQEAVVVRGVFGTHRIRRDQITSITSWPSIKWSDDFGRSRSTQVSALNVRRDRALPAFIDNADRGIETLREWASGGSNS